MGLAQSGSIHVNLPSGAIRLAFMPFQPGVEAGVRVPKSIV